MVAVAKVLFWLALAIWIGAVVTVSLVVAPAVFQTAPAEVAGAVMGKIFSLYYAVTGVAGSIGLGAALALWRRARGTRAWTAIVVMLAVMLAATTYAGAVIHPRARALRPALHQIPVDPELRAGFDRLHRAAVQLNGLVLLLGIATVSLAASTLRLPAE